VGVEAEERSQSGAQANSVDHRDIRKNLKPHSLRYEEIIRKSKDDLRKKRNMNSVDDSENAPVSYRERSRMLKEAANREALAKLQQMERGKSYSKQVREMYMPRIGSNSKLISQDSAPQLNNM
jgi:hypothetical protein